MRSGFESKIALQLDREWVQYGYECDTIGYTSKKRGGFCGDCGSRNVLLARTYTPDFTVYDFGGGPIYLETKGRLTAGDRTKMRDVKASNPDLDIRMVFMSDNKIPGKKQERYSEWATRLGYEWAIGQIPEEWLEEFTHEDEE